MDHFLRLCLIYVVAQLCEDGVKVIPGKCSISVDVETLEHSDELFLVLVSLGQDLCHQADELVKVDHSILVEVDFNDHGIDFFLIDVLSESLHNLGNFLVADGTAIVFVENVKNFLVIIQLVCSQFQVGGLLFLCEQLLEYLLCFLDAGRDYEVMHPTAKRHSTACRHPTANQGWVGLHFAILRSLA